FQEVAVVIVEVGALIRSQDKAPFLFQFRKFGPESGDPICPSLRLALEFSALHHEIPTTAKLLAEVPIPGGTCPAK
ncbi:MAG TPA: hypothetical protein VN673_15610, partial [Clostridia bacterium]|nr:hypothetical protein [Clostridia bacterium]